MLRPISSSWRGGCQAAPSAVQVASELRGLERLTAVRRWVSVLAELAASTGGAGGVNLPAVADDWQQLHLSPFDAVEQSGSEPLVLRVRCLFAHPSSPGMLYSPPLPPGLGLGIFTFDAVFGVPVCRAVLARSLSQCCAAHCQSPHTGVPSFEICDHDPSLPISVPR